MKKDVFPKIIVFVTAILGFFGISLIGIPIFIFCLIIFFIIGYIIKNILQLYLLNKENEIETKIYKKYAKKHKRSLKKEINQAKNADERCEKIAQFLNFSSENKEYDKKIKKRYNMQYNKTKQKIITSSGAMLCICLFNFNYITSLADNVLVIIDSIQLSGTEPMSEVMSTSSPTSEMTSTPIQLQLSELTSKIEKVSNMGDENQTDWVKFKLEYPKDYPGITNNEFNDLYNIILYVNVDDLDETMESEITLWLNGCTFNEPLDNVVNSKGKSAGYYSEIEEGFSNEGRKLLSSDLLDEIIDGREDLMDSYPNGTLAWLLANHNQTYALNYLNQTNSKKSILYFYMKSISCAQRSLEFEMDSKNKKERIEYIQFRYKDIAECEILDNEVRIRAYEILMAMQNITNELD